MSWETLLPLIFEYGIPTAEKIWQLLSSTKEPTQQDWDDLKVLANIDAKQQVMQSLIRNKVDPSSQLAKDMLAAVS